MIYYIAIFAFFFAGFRELSEHAKEGNFKGMPDWWNTPKSYTNKNEWGKRFKLPKWVFGSVMVWTTDAEHFFQFLSLIAVTAAFTLIHPWFGLAFYLGAQFFGFVKAFTNLR